MKILMVSSEAVPFSKSGGLADVATSLSEALSKLKNDVRLVLPLYGSTDDSNFTTLKIDLEVTVGGKTESVKVKETKRGDLIIYFIDHKWFSERKGIYGETSFIPYGDNLIRYTLLSKAALALCKALKWQADIIHGHDWTTGFLPSLVKEEKSDFFKKAKTIFTIHNLGYQGEFARFDGVLADLPLSKEYFTGQGINKRLNMMKGALIKADLITTVSPTYAQEIQTAEQGHNLDPLLRQRSDSLIGILNGIDINEWNPENDALLNDSFSASDLSGKERLKMQLQKCFKLAVDKDVPLIGMISRIAEQKGFVELLEGSVSPLEQILSDFPVQIVIVGTGDSALEEKLKTLGELHDNLSVNLIFSNEAAHLVEAGSDFFLMPSRYEPCGLNQMYSLRYGTIPIARETGGLADSIVDYDEKNSTGFLFEQMTGAAIYTAVKRSLDVYENKKDQFLMMRKRAMNVDFSWVHSAQEYLDAYKKTTRG
jgi:starch synthase